MRYIPLVLNADTAIDGEGAFLLSLSLNGSSLVPVPPYSSGLKTRRSASRMSLLVQPPTSIEVEQDPVTLILRVRSPFPANEGSPSAAPIVRALFVDEAAYLAGAVPPGVFPCTDAVPAVSAPWPTTGDIVPPNFFTTFNGKSIPNWAYAISLAAPAGYPYLLDVDFAHSIT